MFFRSCIAATFSSTQGFECSQRWQLHKALILHGNVGSYRQVVGQARACVRACVRVR